MEEPQEDWNWWYGAGKKPGIFPRCLEYALVLPEKTKN
jgi:hypothetical protein